jgi:hypothetical protein
MDDVWVRQQQLYAFTWADRQLLLGLLMVSLAQLLRVVMRRNRQMTPQCSVSLK